MKMKGIALLSFVILVMTLNGCKGSSNSIAQTVIESSDSDKNIIEPSESYIEDVLEDTEERYTSEEESSFYEQKRAVILSKDKEKIEETEEKIRYKYDIEVQVVDEETEEPVDEFIKIEQYDTFYNHDDDLVVNGIWDHYVSYVEIGRVVTIFRTEVDGDWYIGAGY